MMERVEDLFHGEKYRFMQDNDPKHTSRRARAFFEENGIDWWKTLPESPDLRTFGTSSKSIYNRREVRPTTKCELVDGILEFFHATKCRKYIGHLKIVMPKVIRGPRSRLDQVTNLWLWHFGFVSIVLVPVPPQ